MSELRDRLERLAARGNRRGADDVLGAAMRNAPSDGADGAADANGPGLEVFDDDLPIVTAELDPRRRGRFGTLVAAVGVAALVGVGALAATAILGSGGAGSPEAAVRQLADTVAHKDPLAAVDVLAPSEVRSMRETVKDVTKRAADLKIVDDASQPLAGVDLSVDHLQLSTETLADGYAKVTITSGEISASTHTAAMSKLLQDAIQNPSDRDTKESVDLAKIASSDNLPTFVIAVRRDGGWYVSPAYTALEYAREVAGGPAPSFGSAQAANVGADTPEAAVSDALHAWQAGNWDRLMALAPPDELPVYDYRAWIDQEVGDKHPDFSIDKLSTTATVNGDTAVVKLDASGTTGSGDSAGHWQVGGTCPKSVFGVSQSGSTSESFSQTGDSVTSGSAQSSASTDINTNSICLAGDLGDAVPYGLLVLDPSESQPTSGSVSVDVVRENGRWFVSPVTTALQAVDKFVNNVDARTIYPLIGLGYLLPPDGAITLNEPFTVAGSSSFTQVYSFDGTKGQAVVGEAEGDDNVFASGELYTADGHDAGYVEFAPKKYAFGGEPTTLPSTGSYRLVVNGSLSKGRTITLFDTDHTPKYLLSPSTGPGDQGETCTRTLDSETCSSQSVTATTSPGGPATIPVPAPNVSIATPIPSSTCVTTKNTETCSGSASSTRATTTTVP